MTPRRSSRARTSQPSPAIFQHTNSSSSSASMTRDRSTRSNNKVSSPQRSSTQRSQSPDDIDAASKIDLPQTRQRRARGDEEHEQPLRPGEGEEEEADEEEEEEEITRCLCGQQEFPGLPPSRREGLGRSVRDEKSSNLPTDPPELVSDDIGGMFIQCDSCKVWQHGGCVGIMDEAMSPDEYYCEVCRKDLHRIRSEPNGQFSSSYLPVAPVSSPAPSSRASSRDNNSRRSKDSKSRHSESANPKRRATMNSRDAAYDEEEQLRRAIEQSKEDTASVTDEAGTRRGKRSRSDSEAFKQTPKRQRTGSPSPTATSKKSNSISQPASEDESKAKATTNGAKRQRAMSRNHREKETKEPEEPEAERPEMNRRKGRTDRRKSDAESDNEVGSPKMVNEREASQPSPGTPAPAPAAAVAPEPAPSRPSTRKSGRPPARRGGRVGRNQYTRDRDTNGNGVESGVLNSPRRGPSHDNGADSPRVTGNVHVNGGESGKPSRPRYMHPQRTTMNEMKRRVAGILEFISRMQVEMAVAGENSSPTGNGDRSNCELVKAMVDQIESVMAPPSTGSEGGDSGPATDGESQAPKEKEFKDLSSVEMMDVLTRHLLKWQQEYGRFGER